MIIKSIRQARSLVDVLVISIYIAIIIYLPNLFLYRFEREYEYLNRFLTAAILLIFFSLAIYHWLLAQSVKKRKESLALIAAQHLTSENKEHYGFTLSSLDNKEGIRNASFKNVIQDKDWAYADFSYDIMKKTKYGEYRAITVYYSVMTTSVPRRLPHVFFDSKKSRGRQFRLFFSSAQKQSLEGDFDKFFVTYFPQSYHIDGRSFISPEVMWAIREAADYDIEIIGDQVFMYGDLQDPHTQIPDMVVKISNIKDKLMNNVVTYKDESLPNETARQSVSELGARLAQNLSSAYTELIFGILLFLTTIVGIIFWKNYFNIIIYTFIFGISMAFGGGRKIYKEKKRRKQALESYLANKERNSKSLS